MIYSDHLFCCVVIMDKQQNTMEQKEGSNMYPCLKIKEITGDGFFQFQYHTQTQTILCVHTQ